ncbi:MAG: hypothetical protein M0Q24_04195 [Sulfurimonas sp.]|uniref:hypothetical protein n=1 Tax=Sulfurimonas sp. TaxID=2022749 RepID=UPI0025E71BA0|nr:hypothetical protein [Sulfurimonas sp.]MCK9491267.1 hypothetical protein [Sulfurimonas sp.]
MNEMYDMSIVMHNYSVYGILAVILLNFLMLAKADEIRAYARFVTLFMPIGMTVIGAVIFTGVVMMAAKHLDFTVENVVMILFAVIVIVLENIRSKKLQKVDKKLPEALVLHKKEAYIIFALEVFLVFSISVWMWI